jgi:hypothetical protein
MSSKHPTDLNFNAHFAKIWTRLSRMNGGSISQLCHDAATRNFCFLLVVAFSWAICEIFSVISNFFLQFYHIDKIIVATPAEHWKKDKLNLLVIWLKVLKHQLHRFLIEVDCSLFIKHNSKLNGFQTIQISQVFFSTVKFKWAKFWIFNNLRAAVDLCTSWWIFLYKSVISCKKIRCCIISCMVTSNNNYTLFQLVHHSNNKQKQF